MRKILSGGARVLSILLLAAVVPVLTGCPAAPSDDAAAPTTTPTPVVTAAAISISAAPASIPTDNSTPATITLTALSAGNAVVKDVAVSLQADSGILSQSSVTTGEDGKATFTFSAGTASKVNRIANVTATAGGVTSVLPIQVTGSNVAMAYTHTSLMNDQSSPATLTVTARDSSGAAVPGAAVTVSKTAGAGTVVLTQSSPTTAANGTVTVTVAGTGAGAVTLTASALGATATQDFNVTSPIAAFGISQVSKGGVVTQNPTVVGMAIGEQLTVRVSAPTSGAQRTVRFVTSLGTWLGSGSGNQSVTAVNGVASAILTTSMAGNALVQVDDPNAPTDKDTLNVGMTAAIPAKIILQASPTVVQKSIGSTTGTSEVFATVQDASGSPVGGQPVVFSFLNTTGGGETLSSVLETSLSTLVPGSNLSLGQVKTTFTSGSLSSAQGGVKIRASIPGTAIATGSGASSNDVAIVIGGTAGSITFGEAVVLAETAGDTMYQHTRSVLVADSNGNPVQGALVTLSLWPEAYYTGGGCVVSSKKIPNEDINENTALDVGEDANGDGALWPVNSAAGTIPGTVTTDANGLAVFEHIYTKSNAIWTHARLRAKALVQGTETRSQVTFRLVPLEKDASPCRLPNSPYGLVPPKGYELPLP